jgi:hypothetical protein
VQTPIITSHSPALVEGPVRVAGVGAGPVGVARVAVGQAAPSSARASLDVLGRAPPDEDRLAEEEHRHLAADAEAAHVDLDLRQAPGRPRSGSSG